jgi:hypothetical protein
MAYKLAIAAVLVATVAFSTNDNGATKNFKFKLHFDRLSEDEWNNRIKNDRGLADQANVKKTLIEITRGWEGQQLVVDEETGEPAPFCPEALEEMYSIPAFTDVALAAYIKEVSARVKT